MQRSPNFVSRCLAEKGILKQSVQREKQVGGRGEQEGWSVCMFLLKLVVMHSKAGLCAYSLKGVFSISLVNQSFQMYFHAQ